MPVDFSCLRSNFYPFYLDSFVNLTVVLSRFSCLDFGFMLSISGFSVYEEIMYIMSAYVIYHII